MTSSAVVEQTITAPAPTHIRIMRSPSAGSVEDSSSARFQPSRWSNPPDGIPPGEGLRMISVFRHEPVMVREVIDAFAPVAAGLMVDATVGGGGHAEALLIAYPQLRLLGVDVDPVALSSVSRRLSRFGDRIVVKRARFDSVAEMAKEVALNGEPIAGFLFDLGVSSPQFDDPRRGFSYRANAPLDMRMDPDNPLSARDLVNDMRPEEMAELFAQNGEGRFARRIAEAIVRARPIDTTLELSDVVKAAIPAPARRTGGHPARRVFQALRIAVNRELDVLERALPPALEALSSGGRCAVISYHSGEDRLVKAVFARAVSGGCKCPPGLPCACGAVSRGRLVFRGARRPTPAEVEHNHRAESARLRVFERTKSR